MFPSCASTPMNSVNECFWFGQVWLGLGSDGEPAVIFVVVVALWNFFSVFLVTLMLLFP